MKVQLINTSWGYVAAAWEDQLLAGLTLPHTTGLEALSTLGEYVKTDFPLFSPIPGQPTGPVEQQLAEQVVRYFAGQRVAFEIPLAWARVTPFQQRVLKVVAAIPYGKALSYGAVASLVGNPKGARAVGGAVGANPWPLVIPCHRVLAHNQGLGGFGSGLAWKEKLLQLENIDYKTDR